VKVIGYILGAIVIFVIGFFLFVGFYTGEGEKRSWDDDRREQDGGRESAVVYDKDISVAAYSEEEKVALVAEGELIYRQHVCKTCHVKGGLGRPLRNIAGKYDVPALVQYLTEPKPPMPVFPLTEEEKEALAVYLIESY